MVITGREGQTKSTRNIIKRIGEGVEVGGGGGVVSVEAKLFWS